MKKLPYVKNGFSLYIDLSTGALAWCKKGESPSTLNLSVLADAYNVSPRKACQRALALTRGIDDRKRLEAINTLLGTYGVETIRGNWQNGYWCDIVAVYCNTGDTYDTTVIQVRGKTRFSDSRFIVSSVGDFVERNAKRHGII